MFLHRLVWASFLLAVPAEAIQVQAEQHIEVSKPVKDAVLASAYGYPAIAGRNFVCSLRRTTFTGDIILFIGENEEPHPFVKEYNVKVRHLPEGDDRVVGRIAQASECRDGGYRYCLLADYRDVFFQRDPFSRFPVGKDLVFAQEGETKGTIGTNPFNRYWMTQCLGSYGASKTWTKTIYKRGVICSGTIAGTPEGLIALTETLKKAAHALPACKGGPLDQPLVNIVAHWATTEPEERAPLMQSLGIQIEPTGKGMITTLGLYAEVANSTRIAPVVQRNSEGEILEFDGKTVSAVVHQYDRFDYLQAWADSRMQTCKGFGS